MFRCGDVASRFGRRCCQLGDDPDGFAACAFGFAPGTFSLAPGEFECETFNFPRGDALPALGLVALGFQPGQFMGHEKLIVSGDGGVRSVDVRSRASIRALTVRPVT